LKPGHDADWDEIVNIVKPALIKANPDDSWAMYARAYGSGGFAYVVVRVMKSASEIDHAYADNPKFIAAVGAEGMKKLGELSSAAIAESETNLFIINPRMSYVGPEMMNADPDFWKSAQVVPPAGPGTAADKAAQ
ncbi:MAG: hypothetical protein WCA00_16460, partial [Candidatus Acidiferrales bacterium]